MQRLLKKPSASKFNAGLLDMPTTCSECGRKYQIGGPLWSEPMFDASWVSKAIAYLNANPQTFASHSRLVGRLAAIEQELADQPLFYHLPSMCHVLHLQCLPIVCSAPPQ
jgi:tRNA (guanine26-N2/guanine27-N2)-dimethyltransferase